MKIRGRRGDCQCPSSLLPWTPPPPPLYSLTLNYFPFSQLFAGNELVDRIYFADYTQGWLKSVNADGYSA